MRDRYRRCALLLLLAGLAARPSSADDGAIQLVRCINEATPEGRVTSWTGFMAQPANTSIRAAAAWWSPYKAGSALTLAVHLPYDRLTELLVQCRLWPGPISAVMYIGIPIAPGSNEAADASNKLQQATAAVEQLYRKVQPQQQQAAPAAEYICQLDLLMVYEFLDDGRNLQLYPAAALRNIARLQVGLGNSDVAVGMGGGGNHATMQRAKSAVHCAPIQWLRPCTGAGG